MSEQKSRRQRRVFSASFKADAVKVVRAQERPVKEIAKDVTPARTGDPEVPKSRHTGPYAPH